MFSLSRQYSQVRLPLLFLSMAAAFSWYVPPIQAGNFNAADAAQLITILQGSVLADGDTIILTGTDYDISSITSTLNINKQITIKSGTNATLRTATSKDFPWLGANSSVRFENITFQFLRTIPKTIRFPRHFRTSPARDSSTTGKI